MSQEKRLHPEDYYDRYSRQHYVLGEVAMNRMSKSNVFISGLGGLGVEIAKNVALAGVRQLTIHDDQLVDWSDLSTQYYVCSGDVGRNRAEASFEKIAELNCYVQCELDTRPLTESTEDFGFLDSYACVVLTEKSRALQLSVSDYCHSRNIKVIIADVFGVFGWVFSDCGEDHEIFDKSDEPVREVMLQSVRREKSDSTEDGVVCATCLDNHMHGLEEGDYVKLMEVRRAKPSESGGRGVLGTEDVEQSHAGMSELPYRICKVGSPYRFYIAVDRENMKEVESYEHGGLAIQVKVPIRISYAKFRDAWANPKYLPTDFSKLESISSIHVGIRALYEWAEGHGSLPEPWSEEHAAEVLERARQIQREHFSSCEQPLSELLVKQISWTARCSIAPITSFLGGVVSQEVIKAISGKHMPLDQFLYFDATEILAEERSDDEKGDRLSLRDSQHQPPKSRYDTQITLLGKALHEKIRSSRLLLVGAGAIGCEVLKNLAMLGCACDSSTGKVIVTDNDLIEKSNLNRQFLFRDSDLQKPKSTTAACVVKAMNPDMQIEARLDKVCKDTEKTYSDELFQTLDVVVNALDNIASRIYVDQRCVLNKKPLLDPGTQGVKGHLQVIVPHLTESYSSHTDPREEDSYPVCTLKSFPSSIEHTIQWAMTKFNTLFNEKPTQLRNFLDNRTAYIDNLTQKKNQAYPRFHILRYIYKTFSNPPRTWMDCVQLARNKFQSYYYNLIRHLIDAFPLDTKLPDGSLFWALPKRPPIELQFCSSNPDHMAFIFHTAMLYAKVFNVQPCHDLNVTRELADRADVAPYVEKNKKIETDPNIKAVSTELSQTQIDELDSIVEKLIQFAKTPSDDLKITPLTFEKDDDSNHHVDFITACSNLRAQNYNISTADQLETKRIAGKIIPAIATTTASISGLLCIELIKILKKMQLDHYKNCFLNLALPYFQFSEPGPAPRKYISSEVYYTLWDSWEVDIGDVTVEQFIQHFQDVYKLQVTAICHGIISLYLPIIPTHKARLKKKLSTLIKDVPQGQTYADLIVTFQNEEEEDVDGPNIRFYWKK